MMRPSPNNGLSAADLPRTTMPEILSRRRDNPYYSLSPLGRMTYRFVTEILVFGSKGLIDLECRYDLERDLVYSKGLLSAGERVRNQKAYLANALMPSF